MHEGTIIARLGMQGSSEPHPGFWGFTPDSPFRHELRREYPVRWRVHSSVRVRGHL